MPEYPHLKCSMETSTTPQKNKVIHVWSRFDKVGVRYENQGEIKESLIPYSWYFAILRKNRSAVEKILDTASGVMYEDDPNFPDYTKVHCKDVWSDKQKIQSKNAIVLAVEKAGIPTFEGDLPLDRRWYIDKEIEVSNCYRKLYFDIETDDSIPKIEIGRDWILSFSAIDSAGKKYFEILKDRNETEERKFLIKVLKIISNYDMLLGWNSSEFDIPYLKLRMKKYNLNKTKEYCWGQLGDFDLLKRFRHIFRFDSHLRSFSLEFISQHFLGKGKISRDEKVIDLWLNNKDKLKEYNIHDSLLVKELDEKLGVSNMMIRQSQWCGVPAAHFGLYSIIDAYILKKAHSIHQFARTSIRAIEERSYSNKRGRENPDETSTEKAKYTGAIVLDPSIGKYDRVYTFDFKGLYPSMMRTSNIGYDTVRNEPCDNCIINPGTNSIKRRNGEGPLVPTFFIKDKSVINLAISDLIHKRKVYKDLKLKMIEEGQNKGQEWERVVSDEIIVKELANSTYGIMGLEYGRYFSIDIAESITLFGQYCITFAKKYFESLGYPVIYGDTDSVFVSTGKTILDVDTALEGFHISLEKELKEKYNIDESFIQLNFDKQYESFILIAKKTYVGHVVNMEGKKTNEIYARGLDFIKKNTFGYAAKKQKELIDYVLYKNPSRDDMKKWMEDTKKEFDGRTFSKDELSITQKVGKELGEYKGSAPLHIRLAKELQDKTGENLVHREIEYVVTGNTTIMQGVLAEDYKDEYDRGYYWDNKTFPILDRITGVIYPNYDFFQKQQDLFDSSFTNSL